MTVAVTVAAIAAVAVVAVAYILAADSRTRSLDCTAGTLAAHTGDTRRMLAVAGIEGTDCSIVLQAGMIVRRVEKLRHRAEMRSIGLDFPCSVAAAFVSRGTRPVHLGHLPKS